MKNHWYTGCAAAVFAFSLMPAAASAQAAPVADAASASGVKQGQDIGELVVTGTARPQRRFDLSYAVNALSATAIQKLAPKSYADLLSQVPGIQVESTGGEAQNVTRIRGIPGDRFGVIVQQDGLGLYPQSDGFFFNSGEGMNRFDVMTQRIEIVRGGPAQVYGSGASAIINNITVDGQSQPGGTAQLTLGDQGLYRAEAYQAGALSKDTYYAVGGFIRYNEGYRNNGFPNDRGGQIRANLKHNLDNGFVKVSAQYLNDINVFYLPVPIADPRNPSVSLNRYLDQFTGTMNSPAYRNVAMKYYDQNGVVQSLQRDLADGRHMQFGNAGLQYEATFSGTKVSVNSSLTKGSVSFDALYSTSNPVDGAVFATSQLAGAKKAFGASVDRIGYAYSGTNGASVYSPASASGLVVQGQYRAINVDFYSFNNETSATHRFDTAFGSHELKAGINVAFWGLDNFAVYQDYMMEVKSQPKTLDLVAYSNAGAILGFVTENGVLRQATTLNRSKLDATMAAVYLNDTWTLTDKLRIDLGAREETYGYKGYQLATAAKPLPGTNLAVGYARGFTGQSIPIKSNPRSTNWTAGINYDFNDDFGIYGRASRLHAPPLLSAYANFPITPPSPTNINLFEIGLKAGFGKSYLYATGFITKFNPLNASFAAFNPVSGATTTVPFFGTAEVKGIELDGLWNVAPFFEIPGALTLSDPQYRNFASITGASSAAILGKQIVREPKIYGHVEPTVNFQLTQDTKLEAYVGYEFTGRRYVDVLNITALPSYGTVKAGATLTHQSWRLQLVGENLTNEMGLTEGNPRTDTLSGQGAPTAIYGRPLFGRSFRVVVSRKW